MAKSAQIKDLSVDLPLKNNGVEIQISDDGKQFGDIYVTKTGVIWCRGKTHRENGVKFSFADLDLLSHQKKAAMKAARDASKNS